MAIKGSGKVTVTLNRTTVEKLREEKRGTTWDAFVLDLIGYMKQGVAARCMVCRKVARSTDIDFTPSLLAKKLGWKEISVRGRPGFIGFVCDKCSLESDEERRVLLL
jgi:hypothetical protein